MWRVHLLALIACLAAGRAAAQSDCLQAGAAATFYDITPGQAQYLASPNQFPFVDGPGSVLRSAKPAAVLVVPQLNFADLPTNTSGTYPTTLSPWPRQPGPNATVMVANGSITLPYGGQWTFFVTSSGPMELRLSQGGSALEAVGSGGKTQVRNGSVSGILTETQYLALSGPVDFRLEWHHKLPGDVVPGAVLALEWAYLASGQPTPSPAQIPRELVPATAFQTNCTAAGAPGEQTPAPASPSPSPSPPAADAEASPPPPAATETPGPKTACKASYAIQGPYVQDGQPQAIVVLYLESVGASVPVPYSLTLEGPYTGLSSAWNWEVVPGGGGSYTGKVTADWAALSPGSVTNLGAKLTAPGQDFVPSAVAVNGQLCELSKAG